MAIMIKTPQEIEKMRRSGAVVREVLEHVRALVKPGVTTLDLENAAEKKMAEFGATSAFKGYRGYPCVLCTSVNEQVVHGIPSKERATSFRSTPAWCWTATTETRPSQSR
jgi:methionyl aminopeptidase